jgi:hypothetical protein
MEETNCEEPKKSHDKQAELNACLEKFPEIREALEAMKRVRIVDDARVKADFENVPVYTPIK